MRLAKLAMCDEKFVSAIFSVLRSKSIQPEQIFSTEGVEFSVHYDGELFNVTIKPLVESDGCIDCLFRVAPVQRGVVVFGCFIGSAWMFGYEVLQRLGYAE